MTPTPLKRHKALQPISHEHHDALQFCWNIKTGLDQNVPAERMWSYAKWFFENHIVDHFRIEEKSLFPVLGSNHELVIKALNEHERLKYLFTSAPASIHTLEVLKDELQQHIRFEERDLFGEIEKHAGDEAWEQLSRIHNKESCARWTDEFWRTRIAV